MKIVHIVPTYYPASYFGGPIFSTYGLCNALAKIRGVEVRVLTTDNAGPGRRNRVPVERRLVRAECGYDVYYFPKLMSWQVSLELLVRLPGFVRWADVVHLTSVYSFPTIPALLLARIFSKPVVWSPRGSLQRWSGTRKMFLKRLWEVTCNALIRPGRCVLHVTSRAESEESCMRIPRARPIVIENGIELPPVLEPRGWRPGGRIRLLYIGRLDPKKGIENLFEALSSLDEAVTLAVCGTGDTRYVDSLKELAKRRGIASRVDFVGEVGGQAKAEAFRDADVCVVPSHTENFAVVVAEALAHGVPVIASKGTPWSGLVEHDCGLWVDNDPASLVAAIQEIRARDLPGMGVRGRLWVRTFSWEKIAERMWGVYQMLHKESALA